MADSIFINQGSGGGGLPPAWRHQEVYPAGVTIEKYAAVELRRDKGEFPYELIFEPEIPEDVKVSLQSPTGLYWIITLEEEPFYRLYKAQDAHTYVEVPDAPIVLEAAPTAVHFNRTGSILYLKDSTMKAYRMQMDAIVEMPMDGLTTAYSPISDFSDDGKRYATLISGSSTNGTSRYLYMYLNMYLWDDETGQYTRTLTSHTLGSASYTTSSGYYSGNSTPTKLQFAKDGTMLFVAFSLYSSYRSSSSSSTSYTYKNGHYVYRISGVGTIAETVLGGATGPANGTFSPDDRYLVVKVTSSNVGTKVYEVQEDNTLSLVGQRTSTTGVGTFSRDGKHIIENGTKTISIYAFNPTGTFPLLTSYTNDEATKYTGTIHPFDSDVVIRRTDTESIDDVVSILGEKYIARLSGGGNETEKSVLGVGMMMSDVEAGEMAKVNLFDPVNKVLYGK